MQKAQSQQKNLRINSAFRTRNKQQTLYDARTSERGVAEPGTSDHELGVAIDFHNMPATHDIPWGSSTAKGSLDSEQWKFVYQEAKEGRLSLSQVSYEPWHWSIDGF